MEARFLPTLNGKRNIFKMCPRFIRFDSMGTEIIFTINVIARANYLKWKKKYF